MKNKKVVYFLLIVVTLVWGAIFYRIFSTINTDDNTSLHTSKNFLPNTKNKVDTFSISGNYRDPFLGNMISEKPSASIASRPVQQAPKVEKVVVSLPWPTISFGGMIKNQKSNKQFVLVDINGQTNMMKTGDSKQDITLLKVYGDSIVVSFQKQKKTVKK